MKIEQIEGDEILCKDCGSKTYKLIDNHQDKIVAHKKKCPLIKKLLKGSVEI